MAQKLVPEPTALRGPLDEPGNVGHHEGQISRRGHTQVRHQGGEGIVGNLRTGGAHLRDEGALAGRGHAHQSRVGHELHLQLDPALLGRLAELGEGRGAPGARDEVDVAAATHTAAGHHHALAVVGQIGDHLPHFALILEVLAHHGAHGHLQHQVVAGGAVHAAALAVGAALGLEVVLEAILDERRHTGVGLHDHVAAVAAVTAVGTALGHMGLAAEGHAAGTAVAALHVDTNLIDKHRNLPLETSCANYTTMPPGNAGGIG